MPPRYARLRQPKGASTETEVVDAILDTGLVAHVGFMAEDRPMVIPMAYARSGRTLYLHGASKARIARLHRVPVCLTVTTLTGIVAARSGFHHSVNYRSAVIHGTARRVEGDEIDTSLDAITDHLLPGRSGEVRPMTAQERKATGVVAVEIEYATAKTRSGPPNDDPTDLEDGTWAGELPVVTTLGKGIGDQYTPACVPEPMSLAAARLRFA